MSKLSKYLMKCVDCSEIHYVLNDAGSELEPEICPFCGGPSQEYEPTSNKQETEDESN